MTGAGVSRAPVVCCNFAEAVADRRSRCRRCTNCGKAARHFLRFLHLRRDGTCLLPVRFACRLPWLGRAGLRLDTSAAAPRTALRHRSRVLRRFRWIRPR